MTKQKLQKPVLEEILIQIVTKLNENKNNFTGIGLKHGKIGASLFYHSYYQYSANSLYLDKSKEYLYSALESLNGGYSSPSLYREIAEFGWYLEYFRNLEEIDGSDDLLKDIDQILNRIMLDEMDTKNFDPITGVLSYGYYFLKRSANNDIENKRIVKNIVHFLMTSSFSDSNGRFWKSKLKMDENIYFGITHGIVNNILFLIYTEQAGIIKNDKKLQSYIKESCAYILNHQYDEGHPLVFPIIKGENISKNVYSKNYCYGDYSTLFGLYKGFEWLNNESGKNKILDLFKKSFNKGHGDPYLQGGASIIYGYSGLSMIFRNLYHTTKKSFFQQGQQFFISEISNSFDPQDKYLGFRGYWNQELENTNYCLAEGMIGIALEIIAYLTNGEKNGHDQFFFIKNPITPDF